MKRNLLIIALGLFTLIAFGQEQERKTCIANEKYQEAIQRDPNVLRIHDQLENFTRNYIQNAQIERRGNRTVYIIPLVFHILHNYGGENISDAQVYDAVRILNIDYRLLNADTVDVVPEFKALEADCGIEFRLATIDPNGNCTNGIEHIQTLLTYTADDNSKLDPWPNNKYLNVWTCATLGNAGAAAYAYYPGATSNATDGVIALSNYVGSIGTSSVTNSRTLTHEIGHCMNLAHPWGSTNQPGVACGGTDNVSDTPETMGFTSCSLNNASICHPPIVENVQNYMDYSYCSRMFTLGQKARMVAALNSSVSGRNNLWSSGNLTATGALNSNPPLCIPVADFSSNYKTVCVGSQVPLFDQSYGSVVSNWSWDMPGATPATSTDSAPAVTYAAPGLYSITLHVSNSAGSDSIAKSSYIRVSGAPAAILPYANDFEGATTFTGVDGYVINPDNGTTWTRVTTVGSNGTASLRINNYTNTDGQIDDWVSESIDFSNVTSPNVTFKVANAQRSSSSTDALKVFGSSNCGQTWSPKYTKSGATLATAGVISVPFTPTSAAQWRSEYVGLAQFALKPNVRIKFENISNRGNNTYIDEINMTGTFVSIEEVDGIQSGFAVYPNPSSGNSSVQFFLSSSNKVNLEVKDILGRTMNTVLNEEISSGLHEYHLPTLPAGIYLIDLSVNNKHHVRRLIVS